MIDNSEAGGGPTFEVLDKIVKHHMAAAFAAGMVPLPLLDTAAVTGVQLHLVAKLAGIYQVPFSENRARSVVGALAAGLLPGFGAPVLAGLLKFIPGVGTLLGTASMPVLAAASAYAVGHVFIEHFESGGTLLTFDPEAVATRFKNLFQKGKREAEAAQHDPDAEGEASGTKHNPAKDTSRN